jgi:ubiquinone/menaquinone biosynthesis C-methylase UbiE
VDFYATPFGAAYAAYMERPWLSRPIARLVWEGDTRPYYESMRAIGEVPDGGTIVDCPCGAGPALRALDRGHDVRYLAFDLSPAMLRRIRRRVDAEGLAQVEIERAEATALPLPDGCADLFLSYWGLHCFDDPAAALAEAGRVLKPGGRLVGSTLVRTRGRRNRLLVREGLGDFGRVGTAAEVGEWLASAGFRGPAPRQCASMLYFDASWAPRSPS